MHFCTCMKVAFDVPRAKCLPYTSCSKGNLSVANFGRSRFRYKDAKKCQHILHLFRVTVLRAISICLLGVHEFDSITLSTVYFSFRGCFFVGLSFNLTTNKDVTDVLNYLYYIIFSYLFTFQGSYCCTLW